MCDSVAFPETVRVSFDEDRVRVHGKPVPEPMRSAYVRTLGTSYRLPNLAKELKARPHGLLAQLDECGAMMASMACTLRERGVPLVNDLDVNAQHGRKPYQLRLLRDAGLPVPRYLASNDPKAVRTFVRRVKRAVYKPMAGGATVREVKPEDLSDDRLDALAYAPVLFQELIEGMFRPRLRRRRESCRRRRVSTPPNSTTAAPKTPWSPPGSLPPNAAPQLPPPAPAPCASAASTSSARRRRSSSSNAIRPPCLPSSKKRPAST